MVALSGLDYCIIIVFFVLIFYFGYLFKQVTGITRKLFPAGRSPRKKEDKKRNYPIAVQVNDFNTIFVF